MSHSICLVVVAWAFASVAGAQEARGTIQGTVNDAVGAVVPGANVVITNIQTGTTVTVKTNEAGRYVAPLLNPGTYRISVAVPGFRKEVREGLELLTTDVREVSFALEVGPATESVTVTSDAPIIDVTRTDNGLALDDRSVRDLPAMTNLVTSMIQFIPGVNAGGGASILLGPHSTQNGSDYNNGSGVGGNVWTIDGAFTNGAGRYASNLPSVTSVSELKVVENTFDGSFGHSVGLGITVTTKSGTNDFHGDATENYWSQRWQGSNLFVKKNYYQNIASLLAKGDTAGAAAAAAQPIQPSGHSNLYALSATGPVYIPHVVNLKNKVFWSLNFNGERDKKPETSSAYPHVVPSATEKKGDFSDLYNVKSDGLNYQLFDPFSVRVDPTRSGTHYIRDPLPGNVLPGPYILMGQNVYKNYVKYWPDPNNWFDQTLSQSAGATDYLAITTPYNWIFDQWSGRMDTNITERLRVFGRYTQNHFVEDRSDWTYFIVKGFNNSGPQGTGVIRDDQNGVLDMVYTVTPTTLLHASASVSNWLTQPTVYPYPFQFKPSDEGLPKYLDSYCGAWCYIPQMNIGPGQASGGYATNGLGGTPNPQYSRFFDYNADAFHSHSNHQLRAGFNFRQQTRTQHSGNSDGTFGFNNTYFRQYDDGGPDGNYRPGVLGLSWASFMMGLPTSASVSDNASFVASNQFVAGFVQDTWRVTPRLTLTLSLRLEWENGAKGKHNDWISGWDANAQLPISADAQAAFAANDASQVPELAPSSFIVKGGPLYSGAPGAPSRLWGSQLMWLPRIGAGYQLDSKSVIRGGYGIYYDTLDVNAVNAALNQTGFSVGTNTTFTTDQGVTWGANGACGGWCNAGATLTSPLTDPFPSRPASGGIRFNVPVGNIYGPMSILALSGTPNINSTCNFAGLPCGFDVPPAKHARMQRWRIGIERQLSNHDVVSFGYTGAYTSDMNIEVSRNLLPAQYYYFGNARPVNASGATITCAAGVTNATAAGCLEDTNFGANVPNPFNIANLKSLQSSNPALYSFLSSVGYFTSSTITKANLLRPSPTSYYRTPNPLGHEREAEFDASISHRFSYGLVASFGYTYFDSRYANSFLQSWNPFDPAMPQSPFWQPNNIQPHRVTATWVYDLPFGSGRKWVHNRFAAAVAGGWTVSGNYVWAMGTLLQMPNAFYYGDVKNIKLDHRTLNEWFNTAGCLLPGQTLGPGDIAVPLGQPCTSGWEKRTAMQPGTYQARVMPFYVDGIRNPNFGQLNGSLARDFRFHPKDHAVTFQVRGDVLNVMNHSYLGGVGTTVTSGVGAFGAITQASPLLNRFIQVQAHLRW